MLRSRAFLNCGKLCYNRSFSARVFNFASATTVATHPPALQRRGIFAFLRQIREERDQEKWSDAWEQLKKDVPEIQTMSSRDRRDLHMAFGAFWVAITIWSIGACVLIYRLSVETRPLMDLDYLQYLANTKEIDQCKAGDRQQMQALLRALLVFKILEPYHATGEDRQVFCDALSRLKNDPETRWTETGLLRIRKSFLTHAREKKNALSET